MSRIQHATRKSAAAALIFVIPAAVAAGCDTVSGIDDLFFERGVGSFCEASDVCGEGLYCDPGEQRCAIKKGLGVACGANGECESGRCVDGFCCNGPCNVACLACDLPAAEGSCGVVPAGEDPHNDCLGTAQCGADGRCEGVFGWSAAVGDSGSERAADVAVDGNDNAYVLGDFEGTINFGDQPLQSVGGSDVFLAKLAADGDVLWSRSFGGAGADRAAGVAIDAVMAMAVEDNVVLAGDFEDEIELNGVSIAAFGRDVFVVKLSPSGQTVWAMTFSGPGDQLATDIAVDDDGNVIVTGTFVGAIVYDGATTGMGNGQEDAFVVSISPAATVTWHREFGDGERQFGGAVTVDQTGQVVAAFIGRGEVDTQDGTPMIGSVDDDDLFMVKLEPLVGATVWDLHFGGAGHQRAADIVATVDNDLWLTGTFSERLDVPAGDSFAAKDDLDGFFVNLGSNGQPHESGAIGGRFDEAPMGLALDELGNVLITGSFELDLELGADATLDAVGGSDMFLLKLDTEAAHVWGQPFGGILDDAAVAVATDRDENAIVVGHFEHRISFSGQLHEAVGDTDFFVAKFGP